jgi:phage baseplate assembly protein W|tara:strand:+ start:222 stop:659 length:438 start_codon:yes stop_codon:yes gene_type:complete
MASELYKNIKVNSDLAPPNPTTTNRAYKGLSTVNPENVSKTLYDIGLIKQDLLNHFHIRQGEKLMNPEFGTIIWDAIFEPMTPSMEEAIAENVKRIVNSDPRVTANSVIIDTYESGIIIDCDLTYLPYNISEKMRLTFDENSGMN